MKTRHAAKHPLGRFPQQRIPWPETLVALKARSPGLEKWAGRESSALQVGISLGSTLKEPDTQVKRCCLLFFLFNFNYLFEKE